MRAANERFGMRFTLVDGLRGIAALSVVLFHAVEGNHITQLFAGMPIWLRWTLEHGNCGVAIFFVLSGFVIAHSLPRDLTLPDAGRFMLKRSIRLDPPYWLAMALMCSIGVWKGYTYTAPQIIAHLLYLQGLFGFEPISSIFWTLCFEIQFYIVFAFLLLTRSRLVLVAAFVLSVPLSMIPISGLFTSLWYGFLLGVAAQRGSSWFLVHAAVLAGVAVYHEDIFMAVCVVTALALFVAARVEKLTTLLNWRWLQFLGTISYSLYLIHNPVIGGTFRLAWRLTERTPMTEAAWWAVSILACVGASWLMWKTIEQPSIRLSRSLKQISLSAINREARSPRA